ncbi:MAG: PAS domain S-box protein [Methanoregulaceae archaeon]|nr:PAS domain S-box protein [Methanoregulaceae archaeon]
MPAEKILIVEDDALISANLEQVLTSLGYIALPPVSSGEEAMQQAISLQPDVILMDIQLAGRMNGIQAAEKIHEVSDIPVIYTTAYADDERLRHAELTGPYGYLVKPVQNRELNATLRMAIYKHSLDRLLKESEARYRALFEQAAEAIVLFDAGTKKILEVNPAFLQLFGYRKDEVSRLSFYDIVADGPNFADNCCDKILAGQSCVLGEQRYRTKNRDILYVEVSSSRIPVMGKDAIFSVIAHDISERKRAENALFIANKKLNLLSSITRHDILNNLTVLLGYLCLIRRKNTDPSLEEYLQRSYGAADLIQKHIEFTKTYQNLGEKVPSWQNVGTIISGLPGNEIPVRADLNNLEIYADPLLGKVFYNLYDNSLRHGKQASEIRVSYALIPDGLFLIWEDNGTGVPEDMKEEIFERGVGKNTGMGLFLVRDILSITDITIAETGDEGSGARFEMRVPKEAFRFLKGL